MNKAELIRHEIEKRRDHNLAIGNPLFAAMAEEDIELLSFIDSMQEEPVSEGLEEAAIESFKQIVDSDKNSFFEIFKAGVKWKEGQMIAKVIDATCFGIQDAALFSFRLPADNYLVGSKVKVIVIKEN